MLISLDKVWPRNAKMDFSDGKRWLNIRDTLNMEQLLTRLSRQGHQWWFTSTRTPQIKVLNMDSGNTVLVTFDLMETDNTNTLIHGIRELFTH